MFRDFLQFSFGQITSDKILSLYPVWVVMQLKQYSWSHSKAFWKCLGSVLTKQIWHSCLMLKWSEESSRDWWGFVLKWCFESFLIILILLTFLHLSSTYRSNLDLRSTDEGPEILLTLLCLVICWDVLRTMKWFKELINIKDLDVGHINT